MYPLAQKLNGFSPYPDKSNLNPFLVGTAVQEFVSPTRKKYHYDNGRLSNSVLDSTASGSAAHYYSSLNQMNILHHDQLPKASGYACTQTEYTRDGTGRISRQSGLGKELKGTSKNPVYEIFFIKYILIINML